jgi:hypothetical protein
LPSSTLYGLRRQPAAGFFMRAKNFAEAVSIYLIFVVAVSLKFDSSGKSLANLHHRETPSSPRRKRPRAFLLAPAARSDGNGFGPLTSVHCLFQILAQVEH